MSVDFQPDFWGPREKAEEARTLLGSKIFGMALAALRADYLEAIRAAPLDSPALRGAHAKLKVVDDVVGALQRYVTDYKMMGRDQ